MTISSVYMPTGREIHNTLPASDDIGVAASVEARPANDGAVGVSESVWYSSNTTAMVTC
jgi:hypothetical protein